jgi:hypothetical protein
MLVTPLAWISLMMTDVGGERVGELAAAFEGGSPGCVEARAFHRLDIGQAFQV